MYTYLSLSLPISLSLSLSIDIYIYIYIGVTGGGATVTRRPATVDELRAFGSNLPARRPCSRDLALLFLSQWISLLFQSDKGFFTIPLSKDDPD